MKSVISHFGRVISRLLILSFYLLPITRMDAIKRVALRLHGCSVGARTSLSPGLFMLRGENIRIGRDCNIGVSCKLIDIGRIDIGNGALISHNVTMVSGDHHLDSSLSHKAGDILIHDGVWIGASVTIVGPAEIGAGAIIGANSYVRGQVPPYTVVAGSPARVIRTKADAP
jgi:acetyltransferase-like isoleucine patch superfamily enzyme